MGGCLYVYIYKYKFTKDLKTRAFEVRDFDRYCAFHVELLRDSYIYIYRMRDAGLLKILKTSTLEVRALVESSLICNQMRIRCFPITKWLCLLKPRERLWQVLRVPRRTSLWFLQSARYRFIQDLKTRALEVGTLRKRFSTSHCFRPYDICSCMN